MIARLRSAGARLATIVAPAGYGKTTLLARWAESDPRAFAWVSLDGRDDDDPRVFLRYIAAALFGVGAVSAEVLEVLSGPAAFAWTTSVPAVGAAMARFEQPIVLVLDDLHLVDNRSCLDVLAELVRYVPGGSQVAVTSREAPALPLARWRSQGWVQEIGVSDLRLDEQEAGLLLEAVGVELDPAQLSELTERTEGWPSGLYLAALSLQAGAPQSAPVEVLTGNDRFVSEYFRLELLSRLPPDEAQFLTYTSVLDRMCGGLCDAVLETTGSAEMLSRLGSTNGFVVPLDRTGEWYRYHHLFSQLLRDELERSEPDLAPELNRRAMAWCVANDLAEAAIHYGQAAGETDTVAGLVDALSPPLYYDGRLETAEEWLGWFGDDELVEYPALAVYGAWWRALTGRAEEAERLLAVADGATSKIPLSDGSATIEPWVATLRAHMMPNGVEQSLADADAALDQLPPDSFWVPTALLGRGVALALLGASDRARAALSATVERGLATGSVEEVFLAQAQLALLAAKEGAWGEAGRLARAAEARVEESGLSDYSTSAIVHVAAARVALHEARPEDVPRGAGTCPPPAADAQPRHSMGNRRSRNRAHARPSRTRRRSRRPHDIPRDRAGAGAPPRHGRPRRGRARAAGAPRGDLRAGRRLGDEPDGRGASAPSVPGDPSHDSGDRDTALHLAQHRQDRGGVDLPEAERVLAQRGDRACRRGGAPGELDLPAAGESHPIRVTRM